MSDASDAFERTWPARAEHVAEARRAVVSYAIDAGAHPRELFGIELAVSEACTNAVVHGYVNEVARNFTVTAHRNGPDLRVVVRDRGRGMVPRPDSPGLGLGLPIITQMASRVEVRAPEEGGVELCMTFALSESAEAA